MRLGTRRSSQPAPGQSPLALPEFRNLLAISITVALGFGMIVPILPLYARSFGVTLTALGLIQFVFGLTRFSFGLVGGFVVDRFGERAATITGLLVVSASSFAIGMADNFAQLVLARGFGGAGSALFVGGLMNRILRIVPPTSMGRATGISRSSFLVGIGLGPVIGGLVAEALGNSSVFFLYGGGLIVATVIAWIVMGSPVATGEAEKRRPLEALRAARPLFSDIRYVVALAATLVGWWTISGPAQTIGAVFAREEIGMSRSQIGSAISLLAIGEIAALWVAGRAADRYGRRAALVPSLAIMALATLWIGQIDAAWQYYVAMVAVGVGIAASAAAAGGLLADSLPRGGSGTAVGVNQMSGDLGYLVSPVAVGGLAESTSFPQAYALAAVPAAAVTLFALRLPGGITARAEEDGAPVEPGEPVG